MLVAKRQMALHLGLWISLWIELWSEQSTSHRHVVDIPVEEAVDSKWRVVAVCHSLEWIVRIGLLKRFLLGNAMIVAGLAQSSHSLKNFMKYFPEMCSTSTILPPNE